MELRHLVTGFRSWCYSRWELSSQQELRKMTPGEKGPEHPVRENQEMISDTWWLNYTSLETDVASIEILNSVFELGEVVSSGMSWRTQWLGRHRLRLKKRIVFRMSTLIWITGKRLNGVVWVNLVHSQEYVRRCTNELKLIFAMMRQIS